MYIVEMDDEYRDELNSLEVTYPRVQELNSAIIWALERSPLFIPDSACIAGNWYIWTTEEFYGMEMPKLRIIYEVKQENIVHLQCIDEVKDL